MALQHRSLKLLRQQQNDKMAVKTQNSTGTADKKYNTKACTKSIEARKQHVGEACHKCYRILFALKQLIQESSQSYIEIQDGCRRASENSRIQESTSVKPNRVREAQKRQNNAQNVSMTDDRRLQHESQLKQFRQHEHQVRERRAAEQIE